MELGFNEWVQGVAVVTALLTFQVGMVRAADDLSCQAVCRQHPKRVRSLFAALNLNHKGLEQVKAAVKEEDWPAACEFLLAYYRNDDSTSWLRVRPVKPGKRRHKVADTILNDTFTFQSVTAKQPRLKNGRLNWAHDGPRNDREWGWFLNRHSCLLQMLGAWRRTGNPIYARHFDSLVRDWVVSNPVPNKDVGTAQWRVLEVGLRLRGSWPRSFYGFQQAVEFSPAARILMLSSVLEHAEYCRRFHARGSNHLLMEMYGLANTAACWPEFKEADAWFDYAVKEMVPAMADQVYPDGALKELTSGYHNVGIVNFEPFAELARKSGRNIPESYFDGVEKMFNYHAYTIRPDGYGLLNNDSDRSDNRKSLRRAAGKYERSDWTYIVTNGKEGTKPKGPASTVFPWAGHVIMRSGWDRDAHWSFFDVGPAGTHHMHKDRLHLSVAAFGRDILVDSGRYYYKWDEWRGYFLTAPAHNLILVDGRGQKKGPLSVSKPMKGNYGLTPEFDYARGVFDDGYINLDGRASHSRAVVYLRAIGWVIVDHIQSDRPRRIEALWHFHPECTVKTDGPEAVSTDARKGNLRVVPVGDLDWKLRMVKGQTKPVIQGWYSPTYNVKHPNSTAIYETNIDRTSTFAWLMIPAKGKVPAVKVESLDAPKGAVRVRFSLPGKKPVEVAVRMTGKARISLSGGHKFDTDCAVLLPGKKPLAVGGK